ncbi:DnaA/Hda family protein, partial [Parabacteroides distasonis]
EDSKTLLLQLPSMYVYEYLEEHYVALLSKVIGTCFGKDVRLNYKLMADKAHNITQEVESDTVSAETGSPAAAQKETDVQNIDPQLNRQQSFNNYIEGASNKLSRTVGISIAEHPGKSTFNPFFIYGPSGCGKTHLINAIG